MRTEIKDSSVEIQVTADVISEPKLKYLFELLTMHRYFVYDFRKPISIAHKMYSYTLKRHNGHCISMLKSTLCTWMITLWYFYDKRQKYINLCRGKMNICNNAISKIFLERNIYGMSTRASFWLNIFLEIKSEIILV